VLQASDLLTGDNPVATTRRMVQDGPSVSKVDTVLVLLDDVTQLVVGTDHVHQGVGLDRRRVEFIPRATRSREWRGWGWRWWAPRP
jgi:hypothetical protein